MLLIKKNDFEIHSPTRLVKSEDVAAVESAQAIIANAEAEATRILESAKAAFEEECRKGYEKGLEDGKAALVERNLEMVQESADFMSSVEDKMVNIIMTCMRKCIMEIGDQELVIAIVHKVMNAVIRNQRHVTLKVSPEMLGTVKEHLNDILVDYPLLDTIDVQEDMRLKGTACKIETEAGIADASVDTQLDAIEKSLKKHFSKEGY